MNYPVMVYIHEDTGVEARWSGGAYIDLGYTDSDDEFHANSTINVYDYAAGATEIPFSPSAMKEAVDEHLEEEEEDDYEEEEEEDEENVCPGHPAEDGPQHDPHAGIGDINYCDGSCQS